MRRPGLTYANVMSTVAVLLALGGTSVAAATIGAAELRRGAVTTAKLRTGAVTSAKLRDRTIQRRDLATGAVDARVIRNGSIGRADLAAGVLLDAPSRAEADQRYLGAGAKAADAERVDGIDGADLVRSGTAAGGALAGTYPAPTLAPGAVGTGAFATLPAVKVTFDNDLSVTVGNDGTNVAWPRELIDTAAMHSTGLLTDRTRLTAPVDGVYLISTSFTWEGQASVFFFRIVRTGAAGEQDLALEERELSTGGGTSLSALAVLRAGEYVRVNVNPGTGTHDLLGAGNDEVPSFAMTWVAPAPAP
jgi:hypothetical protein